MEGSPLQGLDEIDWTSLQHAYGSAADVPGLLRDLLSSDGEKRETALSELFGNIWHQGTVYPATAHAVPFLYRILESRLPTDKSLIAGLLACIASGTGYLEVHAADEPGKASWRDILRKKGKSLEDKLAEEKTATATVHQAISARLLDLLPYLNDPEPENRRVIAEAFGHYPEHAAITVSALRALPEHETEEEVAESVRETLSQLGVE